MKFLSVATLLIIAPSLAIAETYSIDRQPDGPFAFTISSVKINEGSTLTRESILFNDPECPVSIQSHSTKIVYKDRRFQFSSNSSLQIKSPVVALQVRTILYDVFGQQMKNLANSEPRDFSVGQSNLDGQWRASENDVTELLTTVTYVARVRLADGSQWIYDMENLRTALGSLDLEQKIGEDAGE